MAKKIFLILLISVLVAPMLTLAVGGGLDPTTGQSVVPNGGVTIQSIIDGAVKTTIYIAGGVVVILWIITGFLFLTAQGAPEKVSKAKTALLTAVAGTVLVIIAGGAVSLVSSAFGL